MKRLFTDEGWEFAYTLVKRKLDCDEILPWMLHIPVPPPNSTDNRMEQLKKNNKSEDKRWNKWKKKYEMG